LSPEVLASASGFFGFLMWIGRKNMAMRSLALLFALILVFLAVDIVEFGGSYRRAVWREVIRQYDTLQYRATRSVDMNYF
jgi:hypothetical protein